MSLISTLVSREIHLWLAFYDDIEDERLHRAYRALLSAGERAQELRFYFSRDRRRYLVTRALVRTVLSRYAHVEPRDWLFSTGPHGRPEIANVATKESGLSFNLSHTHALIVLAVAVRRAVGVDVENIRHQDISIETANRFFAPAEVTALAAVPRHRQKDRFFEYWTFKESYIKARGMGLSLPLDEFSFQYPSNRSVCLSIEPRLGDDPARWEFWQFRPTPDYLLALCAERRDATRPAIVVRQIVPLRNEAPLVLEPLRTSPRGISDDRRAVVG